MRTAWRLLVPAIAAVLLLAPGVASAVINDPRWVSFQSARIQPSDLARRVLGADGAEADAARSAFPLRGLMVLPDGEGPFPAVVLLHGCRGVLASQRGWAQWLARQGYVALLVDSFFTRHAAAVCNRLPDESARQEAGGRVFDALGALQYLATHPRVDPERVAVMGWNTWAPVSAVAPSGPAVLVDGAFRAAVTITPDCPVNTGPLAAPVLIVAAEDDRRHPAWRCRALAARAGEPLELRLLADAEHGFDDVTAAPGRFLPMAFDARRTPARGMRLRYDRSAHVAAAESVLAFLGRAIGTPWPGGYRKPGSPTPGDPPVGGGHWVLDPAVAGPDLPPRGASLFDRLFSERHEGGVRHRVPFPFSRLLDRLERAIGAGPGSRDGLAAVLIPLGRSLQRAAADPEFFRFPRIVVAVESDPPGRGEGWFLKDRVFLGYQEKARVVEVISYNETLGRFEFQVVEDYEAGSTPKVRYANRALCVSCHQNQAPIFARAGWDETNTNLQIMRRLRQARSDVHGFAAAVRTVAAPLIDNATDRANLLSIWQLLWGEACSGAGAPRCRASALAAALQYRLAASTDHDRDRAAYRIDFLAPVQRHWRSHWPRGLAVPDPDIANREPLLEPAPMDIQARVDPLNARPPLALWHWQGDPHRLVAGLAESLPAWAVARLDRWLVERGTAAAGDAGRGARVSMPCRVEARSGRGGHGRAHASCRIPGSQVRAELELTLDRGRMSGGQVRYLMLPEGAQFERLRVHAADLADDGAGGTRIEARVSHRENGLRLRRPDGNSLRSLALSWQGRVPAGAGAMTVYRDGTLALAFRDDFAPVLDATRRMAEAAAADPGRELARVVYRPRQVVLELLSELGMSLPDDEACCAPAPPAVVAKDSPVPLLPAGGEDGVVERFRRHCGACHQGDTLTPPGFLRGSDATVRETLRHCAPRIAVRLGMWGVEDEERVKSPMPPTALITARGLDATAWSGSEDYAAMLWWALAQLPSEHRARQMSGGSDEGKSMDYEQLRTCLMRSRLAGGR